MDIYKRFQTEDIITADVQTISSPLWSGDVNPLTSFHTASNTSSFEYYVPVYNLPATNSGSAVQFSVAFGHIGGSGSIGDTTVVDSTGNTPSKAIYNQFRNLLLPPTTNGFSINSATAESCYFVVLDRARYKQKLDPGNWELHLGTAKYKFIDGSGAGEDATVNAAGRIFKIYSGSGGTKFSSTEYGLAYPDLGILVFSASALTLTGAPTTLTATAAKNALIFTNQIKSASYFAARTEERITSNHYFVRVTNQQYNFSNNPTFVTGSNGRFRWSAMLRNPHVYITTIGLYDDNNRMLAVAKLSRPILKTFNREALIKVKIDY